MAELPNFLDSAVLKAAVLRARETFDRHGHVKSLTINPGENFVGSAAVAGFNLGTQPNNLAAGLTGKNYAIAFADTNHNGKLDGSDTVVIAGDGYIVTAAIKDIQNAARALVNHNMAYLEATDTLTISYNPRAAQSLIRDLREGVSDADLGQLVSYIAKHQNEAGPAKTGQGKG